MNELLNWLVDIDTTIFLFINGWHPAVWVDETMLFLTGKWIWVPFYVMLAAYIVYKQRSMRAVMVILAIGLSVGMADFICASMIRPLVARMRPSNPDNPISALTLIVDNYRCGRFGFPSCHAANTSALAAFICFYYRHRVLSACIIAWVILQCYTRIYLGVHYPGDILVGLILGVSSSFAVYSVFVLLQRVSLAKLRIFIPGHPKIHV